MIELPGAAPALDELRVVSGYDALGAGFVELRDPTPLPDPYLLAFNEDVAHLIGLDSRAAGEPSFLRLASGGARFTSVRPYAAVYAGHQFGVYVPQLGDGRAIALGEVVAPDESRWEWQLKGAGTTAFSRFADGRAVLRSTIREYLCSEAMQGLGIPTTRALAITGSDEPVYREQPESAAVLSRLAPSHVRFGSFEFFHHRGQTDEVRTLADYVIRRFYPQFADQGEKGYASFFGEVVHRTAQLVAAWQAIGFQHGVLNTDNMSILGLTIDYGPYGFMDAYDPAWICNHSDSAGRYRFEMQPAIGRWNCRALSVALSSLVPSEPALEHLESYESVYRERMMELLRAKFGLLQARDGDAELFERCFAALAAGRVDYTIFFRRLCRVALTPTEADERLAELFAETGAWDGWVSSYRERLALERSSDDDRRRRMERANPKFVLRNYLAQTAIEAAQRSDFTEIARLHRVLCRPFEEHPECEAYATAPPEWAESIEVSCSS